MARKISKKEAAVTVEQWKSSRIVTHNFTTGKEARQFAAKMKKEPGCLRARWQSRPAPAGEGCFLVTLWLIG